MPFIKLNNLPKLKWRIDVSDTIDDPFDITGLYSFFGESEYLWVRVDTINDEHPMYMRTEINLSEQSEDDAIYKIE